MRSLAVDAVLIFAAAALVAVLAKMSLISLTTYLLAGLAGAPVFAGAVAGPGYVLAPSFGFVIGFIPAAFVAGWFAQRAWDRLPWLAFVGFVAASVVPFLIGVPYLALILATVLGQDVTFAGVMEAGVLPFIVPGAIKAAVAALLVPGAWLLVRAADRAKTRGADPTE